MKNQLVFVFLLFYGFTNQLQSQAIAKVYHLNQIVDSALRHYPILKQDLWQTEITALNTHNLETNFLPVVQLNAQVSWQSDVTALNLNFPGFTVPAMDKDWYKAQLDVSQLIYDGGITRQQKLIEALSSKAILDELQLQAFLFRERISTTYFNLLVVQQQMKVLRSSAEALKQTIDEMKVALTQGMVLLADLKSLQAEQLRLAQQINSIQAGEDGILAALSFYTQLPLSLTDSFALPVIEVETVYNNLRPEMQLFEKQSQQLDLMDALVTSKRKPMIAAFAQAGYGRPGYNMLDDAFNDFYMVGLRFNYRIWDWGKSKRDTQIIGFQQKIIESKLSDFEQNSRAQYLSQQKIVDALKQNISIDFEIIDLHNEIVATTRVKMQEGVVTAAVFITEFEKLIRAQIAYETNRIQLQKARLDLNFLTGKGVSYE